MNNSNIILNEDTLPKLKTVKSSDSRKRNRYIIITHIRNLSIRLDPLRPDLMRFTKSFVFDKINQYYDKLSFKSLPFHYYVSCYKKDWYVNVGAALTQRSDFCEEAVKYGLLPDIYKDAIIIAVQDDLDIRIPDERMYDVINHRICRPLVRTLKLPDYLDSIFFFDEVFDLKKYNDWYLENKTNIKYPYDVRSMRYFDRVIFNLSYRGQL